MEDGVLEEKTVDLVSGSRIAVATFIRYPNGWVIDTISEEDLPDMGDSDSLFPTLEKAITEAKRMWP
jgi:hypothetical protein